MFQVSFMSSSYKMCLLFQHLSLGNLTTQLGYWNMWWNILLTPWNHQLPLSCLFFWVQRWQATITQPKGAMVLKLMRKGTPQVQWFFGAKLKTPNSSPLKIPMVGVDEISFWGNRAIFSGSVNVPILKFQEWKLKISTSSIRRGHVIWELSKRSLTGAFIAKVLGYTFITLG